MRIPFRRQPSRFDRFRSKVERFLPDFDRDDDDDEDEDDDEHEDDILEQDEFVLSGLHWLTAGLFIAAGAETVFGKRRGDFREPEAVRWAPLVTAPLAGAAHAAHALWPSSTTRTLTNVVDGLAIGVGAAGLASSIYNARQDQKLEEGSWPDQVPSFAPLAFAAIGVLGMVLLEEEEDTAEVHEQLASRARIVERLVPKRKPKFDHIVVHV
jgi:hypothetical protein